jgi:hypothetical protein
MVRLGAAWFLRTDPELALYGRYVVSKRLADEHFEFEFPQLHNALDNLLRGGIESRGHIRETQRPKMASHRAPTS